MNCFGNPFMIHAKSILTILACQVLVMGAVESYRANQVGLASEYLDLLPGGSVSAPGARRAPFLTRAPQVTF